MRKILSFIASLLPFSAKADLVVEGIASYYAEHYEGKTMANGRPYRSKQWSVATNDERFLLGEMVYIEYVTNKGRYRSAIAEVTDRGPADRLKTKQRYFDFSYSLFQHLENPLRGVIKVTVKRVANN